MIATASIAKHPLHPMLIPLPIGMWIFSLVCDVVALATDAVLWSGMAYYAMAGGLIGALLAALPGLVDLVTMNSSFVRRLGIWHGGINVLIVAMFAINLLWRRGGESGAAGPVILSIVAVLLLAVSGWLGGELVYVHGVAVEPAERQKL